MVIKKRIPEGFYKLFRTKNRDAYMQFLADLYIENNKAYSAFGLTIDECKAILHETAVKSGIFIVDDGEEQDEASEYEPTDDMELDDTFGDTISIAVRRFVKWGWLKRDFDERLNKYVLTFPEYSQMFVELFVKLSEDDDSRERESLLSIYSMLFTYDSDKDSNNDILKNALSASRNLGQMLSNMQDGMRFYFDELSKQKNFIGIQQVLIEEINNNYSKKYAILTTTDSFYRYKESVKDLISHIYTRNDNTHSELERQRNSQTVDSVAWVRSGRQMERCDEANGLVAQIEHEFDIIERKYNKLIEQKMVFAKRALMRIRYTMQEGLDSQDSIVSLISILNRTNSQDEILEEFASHLCMTEQFGIFEDDSLYSRKDYSRNEFSPKANSVTETLSDEIGDFVPKPLYTKRQLDEFRKAHMSGDSFVAGKDAVSSMEDLEKLMFIWQEATGTRMQEDNVSLTEEFVTDEGFTYSGLKISGINYLESGDETDDETGTDSSDKEKN